VSEVTAVNLQDRLEKDKIQLAITYGLYLPELMKARVIFDDGIVCMAPSHF
jgi:DNA-binding transcriptional LysR family regulator